MNLRERILVATGALFGRDVIGEKAKQAIEQSKASAATSTVISYGMAKSPETQFEPLVKAGWRRNELIYACVSKKANTTAQVALRIYDKNDVEIENHPLRRLISRPNPHMTESDFWASIIILQDFAGNAYFEKVRSRAGRTVELWPMRPDWVRATIDHGTNMINGYIYTIPGLSPVPYSVEDVVSFKLYDPLNAYYGYPPVAVAARIGDLDNSTTDYVRQIFEKGGVPPGILTTTQPINDTIAERIRAMYRQQYGGYQSWDAPMVLGYDTKYQETGLGIEKMGIDILNRRAEVRICLALRVPAVIVGAEIGLERASLSNVREYQRDWWDNDLFPIYKSYADAVREQLAPEFGEGFDIAWDFDEVPALQEDRDKRRQQALEAFRAGAITRNQFNIEWGIAELGPRGDVYVMSGMMIEVPSTMSLNDLLEEDESEEEVDDVSDDEEDMPMMDDEDMEPDKSVKSVNFPPIQEQERSRFEKQISRSLSLYLKGQLKRLASEIQEHVDQRRVKESKQPPMGSRFWDDESQHLFDVLLPVLASAIEVAARESYDDLAGRVELGVSWEIVSQAVPQWAEQHTAEIVAEISKTSMDGFLAEFEKWLQSGEPLDSLILSLEQYYSPVRAEMIAVTETTRAFAEGNINVWKETGFVSGFDVVTARDDVVCPTCIDQYKQNPHKLKADPPPYHVRCRCAVRPVMKA